MNKSQWKVLLKETEEAQKKADLILGLYSTILIFLIGLALVINHLNIDVAGMLENVGILNPVDLIKSNGGLEKLE